MIAADLSKALREIATPERAKASAWFFKTGPGQYGEGDRFLGVTVPEQRKIAKQFKNLPLPEVEKLIMSPWHEERLTGLFILVGQFQRGNESNKKSLYEFYMSHTKNINNWDLVDSSAGYIVGPWLADKPEKMKVLTKLAKSPLLWERRIAMISTQSYINKGSADEAIIIAQMLLDDRHDLIQKAVGWMLRELGKRVDRQILLNFLDEHAATMPRTTLRYAIEHLPVEQRQHYLAQKNGKISRNYRSLTEEFMAEEPKEKRKIIHRKEVTVSLPVVKAPSWLQGFVDFIREQGVVGVAVGLIIGLGAKALVDSFVVAFVNPIVGAITGNSDLATRALCLRSVEGKCTIQLAYGQFLNELISFIIIAFIVYFVIKMLKLDKLDKKKT